MMLDEFIARDDILKHSDLHAWEMISFREIKEQKVKKLTYISRYFFRKL